MNAEALEALIARIERASGPLFEVDVAVARFDGNKTRTVLGYTASMDAAITLLPEGSDWRRFTPRSCSVYAASPYNAKDEVRHDGYGPTPAAQLCAAIFKMHLAKAKQMEKARG